MSVNKLLDEPLYPEEMEPVDNLRPRLAAFLIDLFILLLIFFQLAILIVFFPSDWTQELSNWTAQMGDRAQLLSFGLLYALIAIGYHGLLEGRKGATWGKQWMGLRVMSREGQVIGLHKGFLRALLRIVFLPLCFASLALVFFDKQQCALHDSLAGTRVVEI